MHDIIIDLLFCDFWKYNSFIRRRERSIIQQTKVKVSVVSDSLQPHGLYGPGNFLGQNSEVHSLSLLQGIFPAQGLNPGLPHCRRILYRLSHKMKPKNTGVDSLSLLSGLFPTQESNWGLLHYRGILYQLSYKSDLIKAVHHIKFY